jgi:hypothetical protein
MTIGKETVARFPAPRPAAVARGATGRQRR